MVYWLKYAPYNPKFKINAEFVVLVIEANIVTKAGWSSVISEFKRYAKTKIDQFGLFWSRQIESRLWLYNFKKYWLNVYIYIFNLELDKINVEKLLIDCVFKE